MMYHLLSFSVRVLSHIPFSVLYRLSDCLFYAVYYIVRYRRRIVRRNLTEYLADKEHKEIAVIEKRFYRFFVDMVLEGIKMASMSRDEMKRRMNFKNFEEVNAVLSDGKSIGLYLGHYANWEWCSSIPLHLESDALAVQIYHKLKSESMDRLMLYIREKMGAHCVDMRKTAHFVTRLIAEHKNCIIGFIADQSPRWRDLHHFIPFLNHNVPVLTGPEKIIKHYGFDAFFLKTRRLKRGYYEAEFVRMCDNPQSLPDFELTSVYFDMLEQMIKENPELYLWTHNRFKHAKQ